MLKHMLLGLGAASLLVVVTAMPVQAAAILPPGLQELIVTGNSGEWEWVWASPCPEGRPSCSFEPNAEAYGFVTPTSAQWTNSFTGYSQLFDAFTDPVPGGFFTGKCAYDYFSSDFLGAPCQTGDLQKGAVWQAPYPAITPPGTDFSTSLSAEVFWVRANGSVPPDPNGSLPEPSSLFLLGAGLLGLAAWRWKQTA